MDESPAGSPAKKDRSPLPPTARSGLNAKPLAVSIKQFCELSALGRTTTFKLINEGRLEVRHVCGRTLILMRSIEALLEMDRRGQCPTD